MYFFHSHLLVLPPLPLLLVLLLVLFKLVPVVVELCGRGGHGLLAVDEAKQVLRGGKKNKKWDFYGAMQYYFGQLIFFKSSHRRKTVVPQNIVKNI